MQPNADPIRVMLVDDQQMFVTAVRALLDAEERIEVVAATDNGPHALELSESTRPDVALVDLALPVLDGFETTRRLKSANPDLKVIVVSGVTGEHTEEDARAAGASVFLFKGALHREIADAIYGVMH